MLAARRLSLVVLAAKLRRLVQLLVQVQPSSNVAVGV